MKKFYGFIALMITLVILATGLSACSGQNDADVASKNLSTAADNFQIYRKITFYNAIHDVPVVEVDGFCSIGNNDPSSMVSITCKLGDGSFIKDHFFKSDNTMVVSQQVVGADVSTQRYKVIWKPSTVVPDVDVR